MLWCNGAAVFGDLLGGVELKNFSAVHDCNASRKIFTMGIEWEMKR